MNFWNNFAAKHPAAAKWVREGGLFVIVSNLITVFKYLLLQFLPKAFASLPVVDFGWPGIDITLFGETFKWNILGYDAAHGGLPYFCAYMVAMVIGAILAGIAGTIVGVPVLRLRGDYLAIVTLAFGEIIKNIINVLYIGLDDEGLHLSLESEAALGLGEGGKAILSGPMGATGINKISSFTAGFILVLITITVVLNLVNSRSGRAIMAMRDNRIAAESVGIGATKYKLMAFVTSAVLAGAAGTLYAMNYSSVTAKKFDFNTSILILVFVVLGGIGNIRGSIIAAAFLTVLPELLRSLNLDKYRMLVYAIVLILVMIATNNAAIRGFFAQVKSRLSKKDREEQKGGAAQ